MRKQRNGKIIGIDIDGTLTDFTGFILNNSVSYMKKHYGCDVKNRNGYDISEIYDLENLFIFRNFSNPQKEVEKAEAKFWKQIFVKYCI